MRAVLEPAMPAASSALPWLTNLSQVHEAVRAQLATSQPLRMFVDDDFRLSREERRLIVEQARLMLEATYVHLPQKRAMYAIDPIQRLRLLEFRLDQTAATQLPPAMDFHNELTEIFSSLRDLHTNYLLPAPFADRVAYLPFLIEEYQDERGAPHYVVSKILPGFERPPFTPGVELLYWNGIPIRRAIASVARQQAGANPPAQHALGLAALTVRPLLRLLPPDEEWVTLTYRLAGGARREHRQEWLVFDQSVGSGERDALRDARLEGETLAYGFDIEADRIQRTRKTLFAPHAVAAERAILRGEETIPPLELGLDTALPGVFRAEERVTSDGRSIGYLRIFTFMVQDADAFVAEMGRLLRLLPPRGLIIDVRGNGGGNILASERSLQLLTEVRIEPHRWQFINTPITLELARRYIDLAIWEPSVAQAVQLGTLHSIAHPITLPETFVPIQRAYTGAIVLIVDPMCYSATDIFAAGFQDHGIGKVLGTSGNTGAGGANVWTHDDLQALLPPTSDRRRSIGRFEPLPRGASMRVAIRRAIRVGRNAGSPIEDLGVVPDKTSPLTRSDLLDPERPNADLFERATQLLRTG